MSYLRINRGYELDAPCPFRPRCPSGYGSCRHGVVVAVRRDHVFVDWNSERRTRVARKSIHRSKARLTGYRITWPRASDATSAGGGE